jgi:hypothetical protein
MEDDPFRRKPIQVRRLHLRHSQAMQVRIALIVGKNKNNIGFGRRGFRSVRRQSRGQQHRTEEEDDLFHVWSP